MKEEFKTEWLIWLVPALMLIIAPLNLPYEYYKLLRLVVSVSAGYLIYLQINYLKSNLGVILMVIVCILYNPIIQFHFKKEFWCYINILSSLSILAHMFFYSKKILTNYKRPPQ
jgi:hypothetical protein